MLAILAGEEVSVKKNVIANYVSQIYVTLAGIIMLPLYLRYMGAETYGLLGFFTMLQAWFNLLDLGLTPTISREAARLKARALSILEFKRLFRGLSVLFFGVAVAGGGCIFILAPYISTGWLKVEVLSIKQVTLAVQIMSICVALRWIGGLYRGVISGVEEQVWLGAFNVVFTTLRFVVVLPVMWYFGYAAEIFFIYQLVVALLEVLGLLCKSKNIIGGYKCDMRDVGWSMKPVRAILRFSMTIAFTSSVWVFATQTDKLLLSKLMALKEYGFFTLAVLVASVVMVISGPISSAIMPRMANLYSQEKNNEVIDLYRNCTQLVSLLAGTVTLTLMCASSQLLYAWTGGAQLEDNTALVLKLYALGNGFLAIGAFPYYMQYAKGDLSYHLIGNLIMIVTILPATYFSATLYGPVGAGCVWLVVNLLFLLFWVAYVHHKLVPGLHKEWLLNDVLKILTPGITVSLLISLWDFKAVGVIQNLLFVAGAGLSILLAMVLFSHRVLKLSIFDKMKRLR